MGRKQSLSSQSQRPPPRSEVYNLTHTHGFMKITCLSLFVCLSRRYTYQVKIGARTFPPRSSSSKKEARDTAVQAALAILIEEEKESETGPTSQVHTHASFQSILHLIAHYRDSSLFSVCAFFSPDVWQKW